MMLEIVVGYGWATGNELPSQQVLKPVFPGFALAAFGA